jgi:alcohol dehydrogenase (cytochrome c)
MSLLTAAALLGALDLTGAAQAPARTPRTVPNFVTLTDQMLRTPKPDDWLIHRGNYQSWGYSPLDQINKSNVKNLQLVWSRAMEPGINQMTPLVYNGVMYLGNPGDVIQAIDAASGDLIWQYRQEQPPAASFPANYGQRKRSIALYGDNVYFVSWDNTVVALDARTGKLVWQTNRGGNLLVQNSSGPIVANGVVVAGSSCQVAGFGCYVTGHDAKTGKELWRNELIPRPGQPGDETWAGSPFESRWMTGVWGQLTYDPELDLVYYGSSGVGPASEAERKMPGATMAGTNTRFAVRPKTGEVVWKHQVLPRDNWDQECTFEMMIINTPVNPSSAGMLAVNPNVSGGRRKTLTGVPCKTGIAWSFDAASGEFLWAKPTVEQNIVERINEKGLVTVNENSVLKELGKTYHICPTYNGGRDWPQGASRQRRHAVVESLHRLDGAHRSRRCAAVQHHQYQQSSQPARTRSAIDASRSGPARPYGLGDAVSNYSPVWRPAQPPFSGSGPVLRAHAWRKRPGRRGFPRSGGTVTYSVNGRQYAIAGGGGGRPRRGHDSEADTTAGCNAM